MRNFFKNFGGIAFPAVSGFQRLSKSRVCSVLLICMVLFFALGQGVHAQEKKFAAGIGPEYNMNSPDSAAGGISLGFDYNLPVSAVRLAAGLVVTGSSDFNGAYVLEIAGTFRWYFLDFNNGLRFPAGSSTGFFAQAELGVHMILQAEELEDDEILARFLGALRVGYRMPLGELFYIEPYVRGGYPMPFGAGLMAGIRF